MGCPTRQFVVFDFSDASCSGCCQNEDCLQAMEISVASWRCPAKNRSKFFSEFHPCISHSTLLGWGSRSPTSDMWVIELPHRGSDINIYNCPFPSGRIVKNAFKGICFCQTENDRLDLSLCNPATRTWRQVPRPPHFNPYWAFNGMTFDATLMRYTVFHGENNGADVSGTLKMLDIYDSESNAWTRVSTKVSGFHIQPGGEGLYSNGKFYWIVKWNGIYFVVAFDLATKSWTEITLPEVCRITYLPTYLSLSGCDGRVVLVLLGEKHGSIRIWRLNDGRDAAEWRKLHDICIPECYKFYWVAVNSEWVLVVNSKMEVYLYNLERKSSQKISLPGGPHSSILPSHRFLSAFESNNVWWP